MFKKSKIVTIHQPQYFPYLGFFNKVSKADIFVFLDDVKNYKGKGDFTNRNRIYSSDGVFWLTVPIDRKETRIIKDIKIKTETNWVKKHLKTIYFSYKSADFFEETMPFVDKILKMKNWIYLSDLTQTTLIELFKYLDFNVEIQYSSEMETKGSKSLRLVEIMNHTRSKRYLSGPGGKDYLDEKLFSDNNIEIINQIYRFQQYNQFRGDFIQNLSIIDALFNIGRKGTIHLINHNIND